MLNLELAATRLNKGARGWALPRSDSQEAKVRLTTGTLRLEHSVGWEKCGADTTVFLYTGV